MDFFIFFKCKKIPSEQKLMFVHLLFWKIHSLAKAAPLSRVSGTWRCWMCHLNTRTLTFRWEKPGRMEVDVLRGWIFVPKLHFLYCRITTNDKRFKQFLLGKKKKFLGKCK